MSIADDDELPTTIDFSPLDALAEGEVVTHSRVRDIRLPSGKVLALDHARQRA